MSNKGDNTKVQGVIRVRSNVSLTADWRLIPGDAIRSYNLDIDEFTSEQQEERMRYEPCSLCHRTIYEIFEFGCDNYTCQQQHGRQRIISKEQAAQRRVARQRREDAGGFGTL
jgi:hypothetical protein